LTAAGELAAIVKSTKLKVAVVEWVSGLLVPVIDSVKVPAVVELHETVAVPEPPVMLLGVIAPQVNPAGGESVKETVPVKPPRGAIVMVDVADCPALTAAGDVALMVKSTAALKVKIAFAVWERVVLVPVIVTVNEPDAVALQFRVAVPDPVMLVGVIAPQVNPDGTLSVSETTPAKPFRAVTVIVEVPEAGKIAVGEVAAIVKSTKLNVAVAE
jgi:hypothetical protein